MRAALRDGWEPTDDELLEALKYINRFIEPTAVDAESMKKHAAKAIAKAEQ